MDHQLHSFKGSRLNFTDATIQGDSGGVIAAGPEAPDIVLPHQDVEDVRHIALDIGGSLVKLVYFSNSRACDDSPISTDSENDDHSTDPDAVLEEPAAAVPLNTQQAEPLVESTKAGTSDGNPNAPTASAAVPTSRSGRDGAQASKSKPGPLFTGRGGRLHFVKFETSRIEDAISFIEKKQLHYIPHDRGGDKLRQVRATGGGAFKYANLMKERLGVILKKEDEMECLVGGCNFLLKAIQHEAFTYSKNECHFLSASRELSSLYPYLLVNIGSGVSMVKVNGDGSSERVSGTNLGGGTFWGLCRLLTKCKSFDEMLEMSSKGDSSKVDMLVGDIYGGRDYEHIGLSADTIASSFGKVVSQDKELEDYNPADIALALCRMVSYNIGHLAFLNAKRYGISRVFFGGFFIRGHRYTMEVISYAINFWSKGEMQAMFLRHEGFLGAMGAFLKGHPIPMPSHDAAMQRSKAKLNARFVERFAAHAQFASGGLKEHTPVFTSLSDKVSWVEKFVEVSTAAATAAKQEHEASHDILHGELDHPSGHGSDLIELPSPRHSPPPSPSARVTGSKNASMNLRVGVLHYFPSLEPFPLLPDPLAYNPDTYNMSDADERAFWLSVLAKTVPNVVEKACMSAGGCPTSQSKRRARAMGTALEAHFDKLCSEPETYGPMGLSEIFELREDVLREFKFHDIHAHDKQRENIAAVHVLADLLAELDGMEGRARLLSLVQGVLAANIFDWGAQACVDLYHNGTILEIYQEARNNLSKRPWRVDHFDSLRDLWFSRSAEGLNEHGRVRSPFRRVMMFVDNAGADAVLGMLPLARELLCMGAEVVLVANTYPAINDITAAELAELVDEYCAPVCPTIAAARAAAIAACTHGDSGYGSYGEPTIPPFSGIPPRRRGSMLFDDWQRKLSSTPNASFEGLATLGEQESVASGTIASATQLPVTATQQQQQQQREPFGVPPEGRTTSAAGDVAPKLFVCGSGAGGPCLNLRRVSQEVADASVGTDFIVIEGMGRAVHTNYNAVFRVPALKLAMIKTQRVAEQLFGGNLFDCVCRFDQASGS